MAENWTKPVIFNKKNYKRPLKPERALLQLLELLQKKQRQRLLQLKLGKINCCTCPRAQLRERPLKQCTSTTNAFS